MAELHLAVAKPGPCAGKYLLLQAQVENIAFVADAVGVHHVELGGTERRSHFVLHDLGPHALANNFLTIFQLTNPPDIDTARGIEFKSPATGGRFGAAEHDPDFFPNLIDKNHRGLGLGDHGREFAHRLAHQTGLQTDVRIANFAVEFLLGNQSRHRVDHDDIHRIRLDKHLGDVHRFFTMARLAHKQGFQIDPQLLGPTGVEGVFRVDEGRDAAGLLRLGHHMQGQSRFAA